MLLYRVPLLLFVCFCFANSAADETRTHKKILQPCMSLTMTRTKVFHYIFWTWYCFFFFVNLLTFTLLISWRSFSFGNHLWCFFFCTEPLLLFWILNLVLIFFFCVWHFKMWVLCLLSYDMISIVHGEDHKFSLNMLFSFVLCYFFLCCASLIHN